MALTVEQKREVMEIVRQMMASQSAAFAEAVVGDRTVAVSADGKTVIETLGKNVPAPATFPAATAAAFDGSIQANIVAGFVDLTVFVDGAAAAFPVDIEVRLNTRAGTLLASHTFSAPGSINKTDDADLGTRDAAEEHWWLKMTGANGTVIWTDFPSPFVILSTGVDGELDGVHIQAATITAAKLDVAQLAAITADLGTVTAGRIEGGEVVIMAGGTDLQFVDVGTAELIGRIEAVADSTNTGLEITAFGIDTATGVACRITLLVDKNTGARTIILDSLANVEIGALYLGGSLVSAAAGVTADVGFVALQVPA